MTALLYSFGAGTRTLFVCFLSVSIFHITQCFLEKSPVNKILADISKVMLMPLLLSIFLSCLGCVLSPSLLSKLIISALVFSTAGDTALLFDSKKIFFLLGMIFFAFAQISYILFSAFILLEGSVPFGKTLVAGILFTAGFLSVSLRIHTVLGNLKWTVLGYGILLCTMSFLFTVSALTYPSTGTTLSAAGSVIFIISDFMVAYRQFAGRIPLGRSFVMLTYILAQTLIILGVISLIMLGSSV